MNAPSAAFLRPLSHAEVVQAALLAPSPDNNQPWRFVPGEDRLAVYLDADRGIPSDVHSMFDLIGTGAALENARIAALQMGYESWIDYGDLAPCRDQNRFRLAATIRFAPGGRPDPLFPQLAQRCTCRKLFSTRPIPEPSLENLSRAADEFPEVRLDWITDRSRVWSLARVIARSDRIRFEYEPFHHEVYRQLRFSPEEAERTRDGLDVRTLELPPGIASLVKWLRPWERMRRLHRLGLGRLLTIPSALAVVRSGALGVLSVPQPNIEGFLCGGRALERLWLSAQAAGLSLHPLGSLPIFLAHAEQLRGRKLTPSHHRLIERLGSWFRRLVPTTKRRTVLLLFRLGYASGRQARSLRRGVNDVLQPTAENADESRGFDLFQSS